MNKPMGLMLGIVGLIFLMCGGLIVFLIMRKVYRKRNDDENTLD